jgi:hypothetical protein
VHVWQHERGEFVIEYAHGGVEGEGQFRLARVMVEGGGLEEVATNNCEMERRVVVSEV